MAYGRNKILKFSWVLKKGYENIIMEKAKIYDLTLNEATVLLFLRNNKPLDTAKDIVEYRVISKSLVSKSIESLASRDLIRINEDGEDRRIKHLKIVGEGLDIVEDLYESQLEFYKILEKDVDSDELYLMSRTLSKFYNNIIENINL